MKRLVLVLSLLLGVTPALAADDSAKMPQSGADTSTGAKEQSSAPPGSAAESANKPLPSAGGERSSAPEGSSAADPSKPNPALGSEGSSK